MVPQSKPNSANFQTHHVNRLPSFLIFRNNKYVNTIRGANPSELLASIKKVMGELPTDKDGGGSGEASSSSNSDSGWLGLDLSRGYSNITAEVDPRGLDLLNFNSELGTAATLFDQAKPSALASDKKGKGKSDASGAAGESKIGKDWVESDTDEQLMLYVPFKSKLKIQSLQITSLPPKRSGEDTEDEIPMRPRTIKLYSNEPHVLGFEEADGIPATQEITLQPRDWDEGSGTARVDLRFVKFQNVTSLVIFVFDGDGEGEKVRVDRLRIIGETGEKRELGKLEKIGDQSGE